MMEEKRSSVRRSENGAVHVDVLAVSDQASNSIIRYEGSMRDISLNGIRLHGKHALEKGSILELLVELESNDSKYNLSGNVKWVTETTENEFVAGLELVEGKSSDISAWQAIFS